MKIETKSTLKFGSDSIEKNTYSPGIVVPKAMAKVTFLAETYEAISLVFFLRLVFTYMGGNHTHTHS